MSDLIEFLRAVLDEKVVPIRIAAWHRYLCEDPEVDEGECIYCGAKEDTTQFRLLRPSDELLADVTAKRLIVDACETVGRYSEPEPAAAALADQVLRLLALPFADADGYNEGWRPR